MRLLVGVAEIGEGRDGAGDGRGGARQGADDRAPARALALPPALPRACSWGRSAALTVTAVLSLSLPLAVRRVIDNFFAESLALVDAYFLAALGIAALLALGTAARFYLVTRLGERVIADIRRAIYDRLIGHEPRLLRADHDRRGAVAADDRHHARPLGHRLLGLGGAAQPAHAPRRRSCCSSGPARSSPRWSSWGCRSWSYRS